MNLRDWLDEKGVKEPRETSNQLQPIDSPLGKAMIAHKLYLASGKRDWSGVSKCLTDYREKGVQWWDFSGAEKDPI